MNSSNITTPSHPSDRVLFSTLKSHLVIHAEVSLPKLSGSVKVPEKQQRSCVLRAFSQGIKRDGRRL